MDKLIQGVRRFWRDEEGSEVVEWALVGGLVVAVGAAIFASMGGSVATALGAVDSLLGEAATAAGGGGTTTE